VAPGRQYRAADLAGWPRGMVLPLLWAGSAIPMWDRCAEAIATLLEIQYARHSVGDE
jgi:hypothetical protein